MNKRLHLFKSIYWLWCFLCVFSIKVFAGSEIGPAKDKPDDKDKGKIAVTETAKPQASFAVSKSTASQMSLALQKAMSQMGASQKSQRIVIRQETAQMLKALNDSTRQTAKIQKLKKQADSTFKLLERISQLIPFEEFGSGKVIEFPIGLHQDLPGENAGVDIGFTNAKITRDIAYLTVFVRMRLPLKNALTGEPYQDIFFGADSLKLSHDGNLIGDSRLALLGDISIPFGKAIMTLKGGLDMSKGTVADTITSVTLDCNRFKEVSVNAELLFPRSMLVPIDYDGNVTSGLVTGKFYTVAQSLQNMLGKLSLNSFAINGFENWGFRLTNAVLDFSETRNSSDVKFPKGYVERNLPAGGASAWKGVYVDKFEVILPSEFRERNRTDRISFGADSLLIDELGVTGKFYGKNILSIKKGDANGWKMSLDYLKVGFEANACTGGAFNGRIVLPVTDVRKNGTEFDTTGTIAYSGMIQRGGNYTLSVRSVSQLKFDVWKARATLLPNSRVDLVVEDGVFKPKAVLHGSLDINYDQAKTKAENEGDAQAKNVDIDLKTITFRNLRLYTEAPYIEIEYMGYNGDVKIGGMPMTLNTIEVKASGNTASINLGSNINLMKGGFNIDGGISIKGKLNMDTQAGHQWEFDGIGITVSCLDADIGPFRMKGCIRPFENNPCLPQGKGYEASIALYIKDPSTQKTMAKIDAMGIFGNNPAEGDEGRFWFVDAMGTFPAVPLGGPLSMNALGGGAYHHMVPTKDRCDASLSKLKYVYNKNIALGFKAVVGLETSGKKFLEGTAGFEIVINRNFGVNSIGFFGEATVASSFPFAKITGIANEIEAKKKMISDKLKNIVPLSNAINSVVSQDTLAREISQNDLTNKAKTIYAANVSATEKNALSGTIRGKVGILFDFENGIFHGDAELFFNVAGGVIKGIGPNDRAGWLAIHFEQKKWYLHIGSPTSPVGISMGVGSFRVNSWAYLMVGYDIPEMPEPPYYIRQLLGYQYTRLTRNPDPLSRGFAFGSNINVDTGDMQILAFYARVQAGLGFDVQMTDAFKDCNPKLGIDGWYARGQAYAYFDASVGISVKIWFCRIRIQVFRAGAGVLLQVGLPNPTFMTGYLAARYNVMGFSGSFNLKVDIGNQPKCSLIRFP